MAKYPLTNKAAKYARDVISGKIPACLQIRQVCQKHIDDLSREKKQSFPYRFDKDKAERILRFAELMPHVKGKWAGSTIILEPWQCFFLAVPFGWVWKKDGLRRYREILGVIPRKNGKALSLETEIPTPGGFKKMADIVPGDVVFGSDGKRCNVTAVTPVQIGRPCREVVFKTGERVIADDEHEWVTDSATDRDNKKGVRGKTAGPKPSIKTTLEISKTLLHGKGDKQRCNHRVSVSGPVQYDEKALPIDPYVLGFWLGDGVSRSAQLSIGDKDAAFIQEQVEAAGYPFKKVSGNCHYSMGQPIGGDVSTRTGTLGYILRKNNLIQNKHIPEIYLYSSVDQRLSLVQGLMDSDGSCSKAGQCELTTTAPLLRDGFIQLISSLGLKSKVLTYRAMLDGKDCGEKYRIFFFAYSDTLVFRLLRKAKRQKSRPTNPTRTSYRYIESADRVESVPVKCIEVDSSDHTYLVGRSFIPTHNSVLGAIIGLYMASADDEKGAEVYSAATSEIQAYEVFRPAWTMANKTPGFRSRFGIELGGTAKNPGNIYSMTTASRFETVIGKPGDGSSPHCWLLDEFHEAKTEESYDTGKTGMGARSQPMMVVITTAGTNTSYPCYQLQRHAEKVLKGDLQNDSLFAAIYTIDKDDSWEDLKTWRKANPNFDVSVFKSFLQAQLKTAIQDPRKQNILKCKHLNIWSNAGDAWINMVEWNKCADEALQIEEFEGDRVYIGLDLASKIDIAAKMYLFKRDDHYYLFSRYYIPETRTHGEEYAHYAGWVHMGYMETTPGSRIDLEHIQDTIKADAKRFDLTGEENGGGEVCNDPWNAQQLVTNLMAEDIACVEIPQTVNFLSEPMKEIEAAIKEGTFHHDGNPVTTWMFGNISVKPDLKDNIFPRKDGEENKIDGGVATITAMARAMYTKTDDIGYTVSQGVTVL